MGTLHPRRSTWIALLALSAACSRAPQLAGESFVTLRVPIDRELPERGSFELRAEFGAPFDPAKPSVILIADGQQFYLRPGAIAKLQQALFSDELNVVGLIGRGDAPACQAAATRPDGAVDWTAAWQIFQSSEWIEDLEALRRVLVGPHGSVLLYGRSGGAYLTHQYLERYGQFVTRAATQAAVNPFLAHELGLIEDRFWEELATIDPQLQPLLLAAVVRHADRREYVITTLQRQNFFVPPQELAPARRALIAALARGDEAAFRAARQAYQVDAVQALERSPRGIAIRVRLYEFVQPAGIDKLLRPDRVDPNLENQVTAAAPLLDLAARGKIDAPEWNRAALHRLSCEVLVGAGVLDHTVDYRASIALASSYPRGELVLLNDDHQLHLSNKAGAWDRLVHEFLVAGSDSARYRAAFERLGAVRWRARPVAAPITAASPGTV